MRKNSPYSGAHITLKRLWDERIAPTGMSQEEFGEKYDIGTQGMVSQYLLGTRPLNYDAAAKFARGFGCTIGEISPAMERSLIKDILPVLRGSLRRRRTRLACVAVISTLGTMAPQHDLGAFDIITFSSAIARSAIDHTTDCLTKLFSALRNLRQHFASPPQYIGNSFLRA